MKILKFGGASVKDANGIKNLLEILKTTNNDKEVLIVVSAMGKTTRKLKQVADNYIEWEEEDYGYAYDIDADDEFDDWNDEISWNSRKLIEHHHHNIMSELFSSDHIVFKEVENYFEEIKKFLIKNKEKEDNAFIYDQVISFGELISSKIIYHYLKDNGLDLEWLDARELIKTNKNYGNADVDIKKTKEKIIKAIDKTKNYITQGFIASNKKESKKDKIHTTTLGYEGSDYTAAIFANVLNAESVIIWKDVPGVFNADPRYFREYLVGGEAITFERADEKSKYLSLQAFGPLFLMKPLLLGKIFYSDATKMAYFGASVIHPNTIQPLQEKKIPLFVKSFLKPKEIGTEISNINDDIYDVEYYSKLPKIPYFMVKQENIDVVEIYKENQTLVYNFDLRIIINLFGFNGCKIELFQNTGNSFLICFEKNEKFGELKADLWKLGYGVSNFVDMDFKPVLITILNPTNKSVAQITRHIHQKTVLMQQSSEGLYQIVVRYSDDMYYQKGSMTVFDQ